MINTRHTFTLLLLLVFAVSLVACHPARPDTPFGCDIDPMQGLIVVDGSGIVGIDPTAGTTCAIDSDGAFAHGSPAAADGRSIAYQNQGEIILADLATGERTRYPLDGQLQALMWMPDSRQVVYTVSGEEGFAVRLLVPAENKDIAILERGSGITLLDVSPGGDWIVLKMRLEGQYDLIAAQVSGDDQIRLTGDAAEEIWATWSPGGEWIAIGAAETPPEPMTYWTIDRTYLLNPMTGERRELSLTHSAHGATWSPDGSILAYFAVPDGTPGESTVPMPMCLYDISTGQNQCPVGDGRSPEWSPDGRHIVFRKWEGGGFAVATFSLRQGVETGLLGGDELSGAGPPFWLQAGP